MENRWNVKICFRCKQERPLSDFSSKKGRRDGKASRCRVCERAAAKKFRDENPERAAAHKRRWLERNPGWQQAVHKVYYAKNRDKILAASRAARAARLGPVGKRRSVKLAPHKENAKKAMRRAKRMNAMPRWVDKAALERVYFLCTVKSFETGVGHSVDHIVPLKSEFVCGLHVPWNLQIITKSENSIKHNRFNSEECGMVDEEFLRHLVELNEKGEAGQEGLWALLLQPGNMRRLLMLAARGCGLIAKERKSQQKTRIPDAFPDGDAKQSAIAYWGGKRRPDLVARVEEIATAFHDHHTANGTRSASWAASWRTWYSNSLEFNRPPRDMPIASVSQIFPQADIATWVRRLSIFHYGDTENDLPVGHWSVRWGSKPGLPGCQIPPEAAKMFEAKKQGSLI